MNVITATGKEFPSDYLVEHLPSHSLYFRVESDLETANKVFSDPEETKTLEYNGKQYDGFTNLDFISDEGDAIKVRLINNAISNDIKP